jgi:hypothetical protein
MHVENSKKKLRVKRNQFQKRILLILAKKTVAKKVTTLRKTRTAATENVIIPVAPLPDCHIV